MASVPVTFFYPYPEDLASVETLDLDDWRFWSMEWRERRRAWSLRTFLQLRRAGHGVTISAEMPREGVVVVGPEMAMRRAAARALGFGRRHPLVVAIRADLPRCGFADIEVLQNGFYHDGRHFFHIPHWPQPGLVPRDPARGARVETIAFKGYLKNLHRGFASPAWKKELEQLGFRMERGTEQEKRADKAIPWHDYRRVDVVVALRPDPADPYYDKPASKLINAWRAGTPALLGPEYPFQEHRRSPLDFIEVTSPDDVLRALQALRNEPARYEAIVANGRERAAALSEPVLTQRWADLLFGVAQRRYRAPLSRIAVRLPVSLRRSAYLAAAPPPRSELAFSARWYAEVIEYGIHGKLRPWLGQSRLGRLRRKAVQLLHPDRSDPALPQSRDPMSSKSQPL